MEFTDPGRSHPSSPAMRPLISELYTEGRSAHSSTVWPELSDNDNCNGGPVRNPHHPLSASWDNSWPQARRRTPIACNRCRKRKIRCSGLTEDGTACDSCRMAGVGDHLCVFYRVGSDSAEVTIGQLDIAQSLVNLFSGSRLPLGHDTMSHRGALSRPEQMAPYADVPFLGGSRGFSFDQTQALSNVNYPRHLVLPYPPARPPPAGPRPVLPQVPCAPITTYTNPARDSICVSRGQPSMIYSPTSSLPTALSPSFTHAVVPPEAPMHQWTLPVRPRQQPPHLVGGFEHSPFHSQQLPSPQPLDLQRLNPQQPDIQQLNPQQPDTQQGADYSVSYMPSPHPNPQPRHYE